MANEAYKSGMRGREKGKAEKIDRIEIEVANGGFVVDCRYRQKKMDESTLFERPISKVCANFDSLVEYLRGELDKKAPEPKKGSDEGE